MAGAREARQTAAERESLVRGIGLSCSISEAESDEVASEAGSKRRGRRPAFDAATLGGAAGYSHVRKVRTRRGEQDLVYRMFAIAVLEHYSEAVPARPNFSDGCCARGVVTRS